MLDSSAYKDRYVTAEARVLYLTAMKGYGSITKMAKDLGLGANFMPQCFSKGIPLKYAGYLGRKWGFNPALLRYEDYVLGSLRPITFDVMLDETKFFDEADKRYILKAKFIRDSMKYLRIKDKEIKK